MAEVEIKTEQYKEKYELTEITFGEAEKPYFIDEDGNCTVYLNHKNIKVPVMDEKCRNMCLQNLLAFYSYEIGNPKEDRSGSFIYLEFGSDRELYNAMINSGNYAEHIIWKRTEDFPENDPVRELSEKISELDSQYTGVIIKIFKLGSEETLYLNAVTIRPYELYVEVELPWIVTKKNIDGSNNNIVVFLSKFQRELIFEKQLDCEFFPVEYGYEPVITDDSKRMAILNFVTDNLYSLKLIKSTDGQDNKVCVLQFKNGDKSLINAYSGVVREEFFSVRDISEFEQENYYEKLKEYVESAKKSEENSIVFLFIVNVPGNSDKVMYCTVGMKKDSEFKNPYGENSPN